MTRLILISVIALSGTLSAATIDDDAGSTGFSFLKVTPGARALALGGAGAGAAGLFSGNPAGIAGVARFEAELSHVRWLSTVSQSALVAATPAWGGALGLSFRFQSSGEIPLRGADPSLPWNGVPSSQPDGYYEVYDAAATLTYARHLAGLDVGVAGAYLYEKIYLSSADAFALSFGAQKQFGALRAGATVRNIGLARKMETRSEDLPWDAVAGLAYDTDVAGVALTGLADVRYAPDYHETVGLGLEMEPVEAFVLRAGYRRGLAGSTEDDSFSFGAAFRILGAEFGYAYRPGPDGLGARHALTIRYGRVAPAGGVSSHAGT